jgi:hypothetical protein
MSRFFLFIPLRGGKAGNFYIGIIMVNNLRVTAAGCGQTGGAILA